MNPSMVIKVRNLRKTYQDGTHALRGLKLEVHEGEILCVAGPNGAGKTTLLRILATQLLPTSGEVQILGIDAIRYPKHVRPYLGVISQEARPDPDRTPWQQIFYYGWARGLGRSLAKSRTEEILKLLGLWEMRDRIARELSGGLRQRLLLGMTLISGAPILILDEPTVGLDPIARRDLWDIIGQLKTSSTMLLTTHSMEEAEIISDRVAVLYDGTLIAVDSPQRLIATLPYSQKVLLTSICHRSFVNSLKEFGNTREVAGKVIVYPNSSSCLHPLVDHLTRQGKSFLVGPITLEDYYLEIVGGKR
ncbi:ABC transporter ATP-binding protein [Dehalococcoidia bacterium]|nr:ABC transporter ATP-binding protein [Dehalococcoidia bacterium]